MSLLKSLKLAFKSKKKLDTIIINEEIGNNWIEDLIKEKQIEFYNYSDFKDMRKIEEKGKTNTVANFKDSILALRSFYNDNTTLHKVISELKLHKKFVHENILRYYGITENDTPIFQKNKYILVLEYADSGTLSDYLNVHFNELNWNDKYKLAFQISSALSYLHDNDIIHKNLHENNILVHKKNAKLTEFVFTEESESLNTTQIFSMIPYIDPKRIDTKNKNYELNKRSDVYSMGTILWRISSRSRPFDSENYNLNLATEISNGRRERIINGTPLKYSELYMGCWKYEPDERPDMQKIALTLETLLNEYVTPEIVDGEDNEGDAVVELLKQLASLEISYNEDIKKARPISYNDLKEQELLAKGGFGSVTRAVWTKTKSFVVYKRFINHDRRIAFDMFVHELKINLRLPNYSSDRIIRFLGISLDTATKEYLLVMPYADGGSLQNFLENNFKRLSWDDKKKLALQIAEGLNYLHIEDILHKDLHSRNIVVHENNAKIIDFGISEIKDQISADHTHNRGVIAYMEPKRLIDIKRPYTKSSDVYSFGVVMWEISSGHPPFKELTDSQKVNFVCAGVRETPVHETPEEYKELYTKCWDQEPERRPTTSEILDEFTTTRLKVNNIIEGKNDELNSDLRIIT
ncbi:kinase-like domain-containing protein [Rhizophagus clarus]|uniref:Kinase-like domain-containing protein n=1 Tax=Rhizophagus clarus TaxID=94130 RepID=A0A8H3R0X9_9GLOM|nr:kinase-like domain-containing protein [Rhizophagus clarus]